MWRTRERVAVPCTPFVVDVCLQGDENHWQPRGSRSQLNNKGTIAGTSGTIRCARAEYRVMSYEISELSESIVNRSRSKFFFN
jgi:hypothetical protein